MSECFCGRQVVALGHCDRHYRQIKQSGQVRRTWFDRNEVRVDGDVAEMDLYWIDGSVRATTLLDAEDVEKVGLFRWCVLGHHGYVFSSRLRLLLHRVVTGAEDGWFVDHINHDTLDNRKTNLRVCTPSQNGFNRKNARGVKQIKGGWLAHLTANRRQYRKIFATEAEAIAQRKQWEIEHFGEFRYQGADA